MTAEGPNALVAAILFAVLVLLFSSVAGALGRRLITAPLAFVTIGTILGLVVGPPDTAFAQGAKLLAEVTLVLILFHDAAQVRPREINSDRGLYLRLLLVGFPLTILAGYVLARVLFPELPLMMALLLAAALAPTDAGLGAPTVLNPVVPKRVRGALNVESGLNDGLATPIVLFAIAAIAGEEGLTPRTSTVGALVDLSVGVVVGVLVGVAGGALLGWSRTRSMSTALSRTMGVLMLPLLAYGAALMFSGNGFVSAFVAGSAFAGAAPWLHDEESALLGTEELSSLLGYAVWLLLGVIAVPLVWREAGLRELVFAVLALTLLRMLPVALSLLGTHLRPPTVAFVGWFGPRGLASVVFALIAVESLDIDADLRTVLATISLTVLLSVVAHGFSAQPLAVRYGAWVTSTRPPAELADGNRTDEPRARGARLWT